LVIAMFVPSPPPQPDPNSMKREEYLKASPPMFNSPLLDKVTRVHFLVVPAIFVPAIFVFAWLGFREVAWWQGILWLIGGYLVWTFTEYWLHRVVFHFESDKPVGRWMGWMIHGVHHDHPNDPLRLVMPPAASLPLAAVFAVAFQLLLPTGPACLLAPQEPVRKEASRAPYAPPLPGPPPRLRRQRPVAGSRVPHAVPPPFRRLSRAVTA
jgi:hypothetical protein